MNITAALYDLGVREDSLSVEQKAQLDRDGFLPLRGILTKEQLEAIRERQSELLASEGENAGKEVHQEAGTDRLSDLINKDPVFHVVITHPTVLAGIAHVLEGDLKLSSLNSRSALPGRGRQGLHADWGRQETIGDYQVCNSVWLIDDFTPYNGATRVVPGSQRTGKMPTDEMTNPADTHPDEVLLVGNAGDVVIFNAHIWHGGTLNTTDKARRAMHGYFTRRHQPQQLDQIRYLRAETRAKLSEAARVVLGVEGD